LIVVALLAFTASDAPAKVGAGASPISASFAETWSELPSPFVHLRFPGSALLFEFGYRSAGSRTAHDGQPASLRLIIARSGRAELQFRSHRLRLTFPRRSA
jgi:hypothetical protein